MTINIDANDKYFDGLKNIEKLNLGDIINLRKTPLTSSELEKQRGKIITEQINKKESDLLIGFAIQEEGHLENILKLIKPKEVFISKIYYDDGKRQEAKISAYKKKYALHSNWLDYPPEFMENQFQVFEKKISKIKYEAVRNSIECLKI